MEVKIVEEKNNEKFVIKKDDLQNEYDYYVASKIIDEMLKKELITKEEYQQIRQKSICRFKPFLWELLLEQFANRLDNVEI